MNHVARVAGVGLKTVSRVVNGEPGVSTATASRVNAAIEQLGFRRNESARNLRLGSTATIGLLIEDVADPFYSALSRAVEDVAREYGYLLLAGSSNEDAVREQELTLAFCARRVDGLVIVPAGANHDYLLPEIAASLRVVFVDRPPRNLDADVVLADNAGGVRRGVQHLLEGGHRRIGYLGSSPTIFTAGERLRGYREALASAGEPFDESLVVMGAHDGQTVDAALTSLLGRPRPPTALFTGNNRITLAVLRHLAAGRQKLALVGFDDFELADLLVPGVTVVAQNPGLLGRTAADLLFARLAGQAGPPRRVELPTRLIVRGSGEIPP